MPNKEAVLLVVLIESTKLRWYVAAVRFDGTAVPLIRSEIGCLGGYDGMPDDEQLSFLRHRLAGVLQRGCDRLWGRTMKAAQIVFLAEQPFPDAPPELTQAVADHFVAWMARPPVLFFISDWPTIRRGTVSLQCLAGERDAASDSALESALPVLLTVVDDADAWELSEMGA